MLAEVPPRPVSGPRRGKYETGEPGGGAGAPEAFSHPLPVLPVPFTHEFVRAVDHVDLQIQRNETLGLVGESGCGKTTLGRCLLRLVEATSGRILFNGSDITAVPRKEMRRIRRHMQIIFQDPFSSLDPRMTVAELIAQPFHVFGVPGGKKKEERIAELLEAIGLEPDVIHRFPHEFSGGQRQRIAIARALVLTPEFIVADEPVSSLDVSIRAQILNLLKDLKHRFQLTYLYISHDLSTVKFISDRVAVMYLGKVVEIGPVQSLFVSPRHPYTEALIAAVPVPDPERKGRRKLMKGHPPSPIHPPEGCRFHPRCPKEMERCRESEPEGVQIAPGHWVSCHLVGTESQTA